MARTVVRVSMIGLLALVVVAALQADEIVDGPALTPSRNRLNAQVDGLSIQRNRLSEEADAARIELPGKKTSDRDYPKLFELIENQLQKIEQNRADQFLKLHEQVEALETLLNRKPEVEQAATEKPANTDTAAESKTQSSLPPVTSDGQPESPSQTQSIPKAITDEPVDRVALANNLFGAGEIQLALEIYQELEQSNLQKDDQLWVQYQIANCLRRLGDTGKAEGNYRLIAGSAKAGFLADYARWWLDAIEKRRDLKKRLQQLQQSLEVLGKQSNESES